jgi:ATP-dependent Clp endopeptidase proteolytic subunit ClpP
MSKKKEEKVPELEALEAAKLEAEIRKLTAESERHEYEAIRSRRDLEIWDASSDEHRIYNFFGAVDASTVISCMDVLGNWSRRREQSQFTIIFNSPGGSVVHGLALYDFLDELKQKGNEITTVTRGMAASMGGVLLQSGHERVMGKNSYMLIHEVSSIGYGKISEMEDELKYIKRLQDRLLDILAERSTLSKAQISTRWKRKDWWLSAEDAVKLGFADRIG